MPTLEQKQKLRALLEGISTPEEKTLRGSAKRMNDVVAAVQLMASAQETDGEKISQLAEATEKQRKGINVLGAKIAEGFAELAKALIKKLDEVKEVGYQGSKDQGNFALTLQNMAKSLAAGLEKLDQSTKANRPPVWRWPQYLYSGIRDQQFSPIDPDIAPFGITTTYDDIQLGYDGSSNLTSVTYYKNGAIIAVLTLTYSGSDLIEVERTT